MEKELLHLLEQSQGTVSFSLSRLTEVELQKYNCRGSTRAVPWHNVYLSYLCTPDNLNLMKFLIHSGKRPVSYLIPICWQNVASNAAYQVTPTLSLKMTMLFCSWLLWVWNPQRKHQGWLDSAAQYLDPLLGRFNDSMSLCVRHWNHQMSSLTCLANDSGCHLGPHLRLSPRAPTHGPLKCPENSHNMVVPEYSDF